MISKDERDLRRFKEVPSVGSKLGVFVSQAGPLATVNIWDSTVVVPYVGQYPAQSGDVVQLERRNGSLVVSGPANPKSAAGTVIAVTTPKLTVAVDGVEYMLPFDPGAYETPAVNDDVSIDWFYPGGRVSGRLSTTPVVVPPPTSIPTGSTAGNETFTALWSRSYRPGPISSDDVIFGESYPSAGWGYGSKIKDTIADTAAINVFRIYLNCRSGSGAQLILGRHTNASEPGSSFAVLDQITVPGIGAGFAGWVDLLALGAGGWADFLKSNEGGIGTTGPGYRVLRGLSGDGLSGALNIGWT
jgi:hypothetical protein